MNLYFDDGIIMVINGRLNLNITNGSFWKKSIIKKPMQKYVAPFSK